MTVAHGDFNGQAVRVWGRHIRPAAPRFQDVCIIQRMMEIPNKLNMKMMARKRALLIMYAGEEKLNL